MESCYLSFQDMKTFKNGIIYGLLLSALGAAIMIPAITSGSFGFILASLFVVALGFYNKHQQIPLLLL